MNNYSGLRAASSSLNFRLANSRLRALGSCGLRSATTAPRRISLNVGHGMEMLLALSLNSTV